MNEIFEKLSDESARVDRVIFLAGALTNVDSMPDDIENFFDEEDAETIEKCLGEAPDWVDFDDTDSVAEWLIQSAKLGFLVQFATPVMKVISEGCYSFSWGLYNTTWIYAETIDEAVDKGLEWVRERRASEAANAAKEGGA